MKRYLYIIIGIIVAAAIVILVLFLIKNNAASPTITPSGTTGGSLPAVGTQGSNGSGASSSVSALGLAPIASGTSANANVSGQTAVSNFGVLSQNPVLDYFIDAKNDITAIQPSGAVIAIANGQTTTVSSSTIDGIISASFSYDGKKIVVNYGDPSDPQAGVYDVATNAWTALPQGMLSPQWSPINNYQIAYLVVPSAGKLALATINAANIKTAPTTLLTLNANDLTLQWPTASEFILSDKPTSQNAGAVWVYNPSAGTLNPLIYEVSGAEGIWSHNAAIPYGLTFFNNPSGQGGNVLQLQAFSGNLPNQPLAFSTLPSKCAFDTELMPVATSTAAGAATSTTASSTAKTSAKTAPTSTPYLALYCGIPRSSSGFSSAHLPDDYNTMALFTSDDIYKINTATGAEQVLWSDVTQNVDVSDVKFFNNALFFVNRYDQKLYGLTFSN
jgi:hypothetical protein